MTTGETPVIDSVRLATTAVGWNSWSRCGKGAPRLRGSPKEIEKVEFKTILDTSLHDFTRIIRFLFCFWGVAFPNPSHIGDDPWTGTGRWLIGSNCPSGRWFIAWRTLLGRRTGFGWDEQIRFFAKLRTGWRFFGNHETMGILAKMGIHNQRLGIHQHPSWMCSKTCGTAVQRSLPLLYLYCQL